MATLTISAGIDVTFTVGALAHIDYSFDVCQRGWATSPVFFFGALFRVGVRRVGRLQGTLSPSLVLFLNNDLQQIWFQLLEWFRVLYLVYNEKLQAFVCMQKAITAVDNRLGKHKFLII